jgi:NapC/NirT cytochrome c family, N-terminal region
MFPRTPVTYLASNLVSLFGIGMVTSATILWLMALPTFWRGETSNPYVGIILFLILPALFFGGLLLIPVGAVLHRRKLRRSGNTGPLAPQGHELRRLVTFLAATTALNLVIGSQFVYQAVGYMDTGNFCGQACHKVMSPEYTAYLESPHSHVSCVECHIGSGAGSFVEAKMRGTRQLIDLALNTYPRPVPAPVHSLRPARDTCEHCHSPRRVSSNVLFIHTEYGVDQANTPTTTVAAMKVGGPGFPAATGIHGAHNDEKSQITYIAIDGQRQVIPQVTYRHADGTTTVYQSTDVKATSDQLQKGEHRSMDCTDCHNRPGHSFTLPEQAVDKMMLQGRIDASLPFIRKNAVEALRKEYTGKEYSSKETALKQIDASLNGFYHSKYPQASGEAVKAAIAGVQAIYSANVFPEMKVTWGTYPSNLGHMDSPGCFRCHDGSHTSAQGKSIPNDCSICHDILAMQEKKPKILADLGIGDAGK